MTCLVLYGADEGIVARKLTLRGLSLAEEMKQFSFYGRVCAMKGFLQALPKEVLCCKLHMLPAVAPSAPHHPPSSGSKQDQSNSSAPSLSRLSLHTAAPQTDSTASSASDSRSTYHAAAVEASDTHKTDAQCERTGGDAAQDLIHELRSEEQGKQKQRYVGLPMTQDKASTAGTAGSAGTVDSAGSAWMLLSDGALPACCAAVQQSTDAHHKFHAMSALAFGLERIKQCLQVCPSCNLCLTLCLSLCVCLCVCLCLVLSIFMYIVVLTLRGAQLTWCSSNHESRHAADMFALQSSMSPALIQAVCF